MEINRLIFEDKKAFTNKRDLNWKVIKPMVIGLVVIVFFVILAIPSKKENDDPFHTEIQKTSAVEPFNTSSLITPMPLIETRTFDYKVPKLDESKLSDVASQKDRSGSMLVLRQGLDTKNQLIAGSRISVSLFEKMIVSNQSMPVQGIVQKEILSESVVAVPSGSKVIGDITLDEGTERALMVWRSVIFPDGRERPLSAVAIDSDGQIGIRGKVHTSGLANVTGQTLSTFVGAYAKGSMSQGAFGSQAGGFDNGMKNAVGEVATDRAHRFGQELQKETMVLELSAGKNVQVVLNQAFTFRDPGAVYGQ